ncbi:MAG: 16S rRNA (guanine(966)-N(2))-methyltransferase RsmD [Calditrichia bacterium]
MRIIAGKYRGRQIQSSRDRSIRPTTSKIKEYIFQILDDFPVDARTLDMFSGSGGLGIEALSRGAGSITFVDLAHSSLKVLRNNLERIGIEEPYQTLQKDVIPFLKKNPTPYELIFADPPFKWSKFDEFLPLVFAKNNLTDDGIFVLEYERSHQIDWSTIPCEILREKQYDRSIIVFARRK